MHKALIIIVLLLCEVNIFIGEAATWDPLASDGEAAMYRTHAPDPVLENIPADIRDNIFIKPETYLKKLSLFLAQDAENDYEVTKRIHDWIVDSISYSLFANINVNQLLRTRITNCTGYSELFREMAAFAGIRSVVVFGFSRNYEFADGSQGNHAWNIVDIDGKKYFVDTTHDARMRARGESPGDKKPYSDDEFFIRPEVKILVNYPYDSRYQLLDKPLSYDEYMSQPRTRISFIRYGLAFADPPFDTRVVPARYSWGGGNSISGTFDGVETGGRAHTLTIECPPDIELSMQIGNPGFASTGHVAVKRQGTLVVIGFSASEKGSLMATISAQYKGSDTREGVYSFMLIEEQGEGPRVAG